MAVGLDQDTESLQRGSIPSGGAGTLSDGGFTNCFAGVWVYRPSATTTYALTAAGSFIHFQAGAREVVLGFNSAGSVLSDLNLQIIFNSGGGAGTPATFSGHTGASFLDEWVYYFIAENPTDGQIAGYIRLADLATAVTQVRANDNAGSQYVNTLTFGNNSGNSAVALGHYAFARAAYNTSGGYNTTDALAFAASTSPTGMWGFWPLADNTDTGDDSGNARTITFNGTLTSESDPTFAAPPVITVQPTDQTVNAGATATFTVTATGATSYQWKKNGSNVGTSSSSYALTSAAYSDQGAQITVDCINADGTTTSTAATLRVAFNLSGTGPRAFPNLGQPFGAGTFEAQSQGTAAAGGSHATSGALSAQAAAVAGTATHLTLHPTSGALAAQAATVAGSATHLLLHTSTGALAAQAATIAGSAAHQHAATSALAAQAATVAGTANHATLHTSTGALSAQAATISGTAQHQHAATGALAAQAATIAGAADHTTAGASHSASGALAAQDATLAGSATHLTLHSTSGALAAQAASISGAAVHPHTTNGALNAAAASISGAAAHEHAASGALAAQPATVAGTAVHSAAGVHIATGALQAQDAQLSATALLVPAPITATPGQDGASSPYRKWRYTTGEEVEEERKKPEPAEPTVPQLRIVPVRENRETPNSTGDLLRAVQVMAQQRRDLLAELDRQERTTREAATRATQARAAADSQVAALVQAAQAEALEQDMEDDDQEAIALALGALDL